MNEEVVKKEVKVINKGGCGGPGGAVYGLGFVGALVYYIQQANTFQDGLIGLLKAIFWPALLVYKLLELHIF